ncbi:MAG: glucose-6-phosphate dehydrogenase [Firmicutes bacterium]|nr:glucose-6-phosphate dehydrogenase [Bacillota bacterium]
MAASVDSKGDTPCIFVIFGATGDLSRRKLFPALYSLFLDDLLPPRFAVVAVGRRALSRADFEALLRRSIREFSSRGPSREPSQRPSRQPPDPDSGSDTTAPDTIAPDTATWARFVQLFHYHRAALDDPAGGYDGLRDLLERLCAEGEGGPDRSGLQPPGVQPHEAPSARDNAINGAIIFYLAVPTDLFYPIVQGLQRQGLHVQGDGRGPRRVVFEKPFGRDLASARDLNRKVRQVFDEEQVFRIDHYLGKEMIQNIAVIRFANAFLEPVWNAGYIDHVQITSAETDGVGDRGDYYDSVGALRDMVQNHMCQLLTMVAMEPPSSLETERVRDEKVKVLRSLRRLFSDDVRRWVVRGQYGPGTADGKEVPGYRSEPEVDPGSKTETFVAMKVHIDNFRWAGVPFYIRTGKRLPVRSTEVIVEFKMLPEVLYFKEYRSLQPNILVIKVQPEEGVFLQFNAKRPGQENFIIPVRMDFCQNCAVGFNSPEAYERLLLEVMRGDRTLFTRWDEVEEAWKFVQPVLEEWASAPEDPGFPNYAAGEWGPEDAETLLGRDGRAWYDGRTRCELWRRPAALVAASVSASVPAPTTATALATAPDGTGETRAAGLQSQDRLWH